MPTTQNQPADTDHAPVWQRFGHYVPYIENSSDDVKDAALTNFFYILSVADEFLGEDITQHIMHEHAWKGTRPAADGDVPLFTYYFVDRKAILRALTQYTTNKIEPALKKMNESKETQTRFADKIKTYGQYKAKLDSAIKLLSDRHVFVTISQHLIVVLDHQDEKLRHIWECNDLGTVRLAVQAMSSAGLPFNGPLVQEQEQEEEQPTEVSSDLGGLLRSFFAEVHKHSIKLPAMPEAPGLPRSTDIFAYELSTNSTPDLHTYFAQLEHTAGASERFVELSKKITAQFEHVQDFTLFFVAVMKEQGHANWSYFTDKDEAHRYMAAHAIATNPVFRSRLETAFADCEAFKNHSNSEEAADFIIAFLTKPRGTSYKILTAFSHKQAPEKANLNPSAKLPPILGISMHADGDTVSLSTFDAKAVFVELVNNKGHMDKHGSDLTDNLINHSMWANLIDFADSIFGDANLLKTGKAKTIQLKEDPEARLIEFSTLFNTYW